MTGAPLLVVTISRQLGAGGVYVGQALARKLNLFYADREIIRRAASELSVLEETLEAREEKLNTFWASFLQLGVADAYVPPKERIPTSRELFEAETRVIRKIAGESPAVIIGRCGSYLLREHSNHVSVFLHADKTVRRRRIGEYYSVSGDAAEKMIDRSDRQRALFHRTFTGEEWTDATRYDLALDTGKIGYDGSVDVILQSLDARKGNRIDELC